jgi:hypothetical protein
MSALGQKRTYAVQQRMSALPPIATAKADICRNGDVSGPEREQPQFYRSSSTPRIIGMHLPPILVAVTLPALLSALAMSRLGRPISMP